MTIKNIIALITVALIIFCVSDNGQAQESSKSPEEAQAPFENILYIEIYHGVKGMVLISDGTGSQEIIELAKSNDLETVKQNNIAIANILNNLSDNGWHLVSTNGESSVTRIFMTRTL